VSVSVDGWERKRDKARAIRIPQGVFSVVGIPGLGSIILLYKRRVLKVVADDTNSDEFKDRAHGSRVLSDD
jgi:hypothetical protein